MSCRELWADATLRAAYARRDWPVVFRRYRALAGLSQQRLGELVDMTQSYVSNVERGRHQITSADVITRIVVGLQVPDEVARTAASPSLTDWAPDLELKERIARAHTTGRTDVRTADHVRRVLAEYRRAEDEVGGRELWPVVRSQLDAVTRLIPDSSGDVADRLLLLAAEHAHWLSWVAYTERQIGAALAWIDVAHGWAVDGGHADMSSWACRLRAYYALRTGDPRRAYRAAEAAQQVPDLSPAAVSVAAHTASMAAAALGDRDRAMRLAETALTAALRVPDESERPAWLYFLTPARAQLQLADSAAACHRWAEAVDGYRRALPDLADCPRDQAYYRTRMEEAERRA